MRHYIVDLGGTNFCTSRVSLLLSYLYNVKSHPKLGAMNMSDEKTAERKLLAEQLETARTKLRATGASVFSPTPEWSALQKEVARLKKKLK